MRLLYQGTVADVGPKTRRPPRNLSIQSDINNQARGICQKLSPQGIMQSTSQFLIKQVDNRACYNYPL